jgi:hypothetical protein
MAVVMSIECSLKRWFFGAFAVFGAMVALLSCGCVTTDAADGSGAADLAAQLAAFAEEFARQALAAFLL